MTENISAAHKNLRLYSEVFRDKRDWTYDPDFHDDTTWDEYGEYFQLVQPLVGGLLADFLEQEPNNPHAIKIAEEIDRIAMAYIHNLIDSDMDDDEVCESD
jgi:hypothetical protein